MSKPNANHAHLFLIGGGLTLIIVGGAKTNKIAMAAAFLKKYKRNRTEKSSNKIAKT